MNPSLQDPLPPPATVEFQEPSVSNVNSNNMKHLPLPPSHGYPWLLYNHGNTFKHNALRTFAPPDQDLDRRGCSVRHLRWKQVDASSVHGWLLLLHLDDNYNKYNYYSVWNPTTLESIALPALDLDEDDTIGSKLIMMQQPSSPMDMLIFFFGRGNQSILLCSPNDRGWTRFDRKEVFKELEQLEEKDTGNQFLFNPVVCDGRLYAIAFNTSDLVHIDIATSTDDQGGWLDGSERKYSLLIRSVGCPLPSKELLHSIQSYRYLVESCSELFFIDISMGIKNKEVLAIQILRFSFNDLTWVQVESAKDRAFFLCPVSHGFALSIDESKESPDIYGNRIYLIWEDKYIYTYHIEDKSFSVSLPWPELPTPWHPPAWVMPDMLKLNNANYRYHEEEKRSVEKNVDVEVMLEKPQLSHILGLCPDVFGLICKKLSPFDYMNNRAACRLFRSLAPPIKWKQVLAHEQRGPSLVDCLSPAWLVLPGNKKQEDQNLWRFLDPNFKGITIQMTIPTTTNYLHDPKILCSGYGWLLVANSQRSMACFNPMSKDVIQLPSLPETKAPLGFAFSSPPTSDKCLIVGNGWSFEDRADVVIFDKGNLTTDWSVVVIHFDNDIEFRPCYNTPVFWDGAFYFLGEDGNLGELKFDQEEEDYKWQVLAKPVTPCRSCHSNFLLQCEGELISVFVGNKGRWVRVFKLNHLKSKWDKVDSLGDHTLFVSRSSSFSTPAKNKTMGNTIFFPLLRWEGLVFYSLSTGSFHSVGNEAPLVDYNDTSEQLLSGWIEPRWC